MISGVCFRIMASSVGEGKWLFREETRLAMPWQSLSLMMSTWVFNQQFSTLLYLLEVFFKVLAKRIDSFDLSLI